MSVKTEGLSVDSPAIHDIAEEMCDGRAFGEVSPLNWRQEIKDYVPQALLGLARDAESFASSTDEEIGRAFYERMNGGIVTRLRTRAPHTYSAVGAYLRGAWSRMEQVEETVVTSMPPSPWSLNDHVARYQALQEWAANGVPDVQSGVDAQMVLLGSWHGTNGEYGWSSCCGTDARHKEFLGNVMRYKTWLLSGGDASPFPVEVGTLLRIDNALNRGAYYAIGDVVKVTHTEVGSDSDMVQTDWVEGPGSFKSQTLFAEEIRLHHVVSESENDVPQHDSETQATIDRLEAENRRLANDLTSAQRFHQEDNTLIGEALIQEATDRDWCEEYDRVIQRLNERLHIDLPIRESDYEIRVSGYLRIPFSYTVSVTANSHDDAEEQVSEDYGSYLPEASTLAQSGYLDRYSAEVTDDDLEFEQV